MLTAQTVAGNTYARERLILIHLRVVLKIALSMAKSHQYDIVDAVSAGFVGLVSLQSIDLIQMVFLYSSPMRLCGYSRILTENVIQSG